ncbi:MAG: ABC transporter permease [Bacteroidia bacterium]|nr:ABC transporter permease [Bacteroidia bacterium]MDW8302309.1 ABC transporter permease [Bacteroidia bacterium]
MADLNRGASKSPSFWQMVWKNFKNNKLSYYALWVLLGLVCMALLADFIAYDKPFYARYKGKGYYPIFLDYAASLGLYHWDSELVNADWKRLSLEKALWTPIPYSPEEQDFRNAQSVSPLAKQDIDKKWMRHWLGTDELGRDVLSGIIHGSRISLKVGLVAVGISMIIGITLGALAGYYGDNHLKISRAYILLLPLNLFFMYFYGYYARSNTLSEAASKGMLLFLFHLLISVLVCVGIGFLFYGISLIIGKIHVYFRQKINVWVDIIISRIIEIISSIPILLLIITICAILKPNVMIVMVIIGLTSWVGIARLTRAEFLKVRNLEYVQAAQAMGFEEWRIILHHALPNAIAPVLVTAAFQIAGAILMESALSFLGIGVPSDVVTWGSLLAVAQSAPSAWWLAVFPGLAIFITVISFNLVGEGLRDALDPKLKAV